MPILPALATQFQGLFPATARGQERWRWFLLTLQAILVPQVEQLQVRLQLRDFAFERHFLPAACARTCMIGRLAPAVGCAAGCG